MGVTGLWTVVRPCARPIKVETLNRKRLAVDASIWIYQFLKAVRDKEGNALRNSHVVGFFRRICKLLFIGVKPVFVFDGGAPSLKRQTINARKRRREGRRDDAVRTAGKLLAVQMQRRAEEEEQKRKENEARGSAEAGVEEEEPLPENLVYADEVFMAPQERQHTRKFKKKDAYHLPDLDMSLAEMGQPNDPRIMSLEELQQYAKQFDSGEDINVYDFSKIDFDSPFFTSLPASDRYNILNAARLRSRLRMGYSKDQLDSMFPDRMAFSKFQIERVKERNELTQRLMNINGMNDSSMFGVNGTSRIASEKNREYVLVKNDGVEGGWALGVVSGQKDAGKRDQPIDVDQLDKPDEVEQDEDWEDDEFEDVPIEGLNRLPRRETSEQRLMSDRIARDLERRRNLYKARKQGVPRRRQGRRHDWDDPDSLFIAEVSEPEEEWEDVDMALGQDSPQATRDHHDDTDEAQLQKAIALSLQHETMEDGFEDDEYREVFNQEKAEQARPFTKGSGLAIARMANARSNKAAPVASTANDSDDDNVDLQAALAESRKTKYISKPPPRAPSQKMPLSRLPERASDGKTENKLFDGPLPFEKLDLGTSLLGKKKMQKLHDEASGGFEKDDATPKKRNAEPLPPWFQGRLEDDLAKEKEVEIEARRRDQEDEIGFTFEVPPRLGTQQSIDIIDLETLDQPKRDIKVIEVDAIDFHKQLSSQAMENEHIGLSASEPGMAEIAENVRAEPPRPKSPSLADEDAGRSNSRNPFAASEPVCEDAPEDEPLDWEQSDREGQPSSGNSSIEEVFEDVPMRHTDDVLVSKPPPQSTPREDQPDQPNADVAVPVVLPNTMAEPLEVELDHDAEDAEARDYSDPEDEELFRQLVQEQEEHARFASELNNRTMQQNIADYEKELKQLRNQQKRDRRDADEVTQTMIQECQQLLAYFGLPYITAPMEAEAQCAELVRLGLVDGIVTDDSDCFLFGGTRVYKNMFNQAKFVECYLTNDLEAEFGLTRQRLIAIAQLLGSDYTEGLPGIGPVTALEILSEFDNLTAFREWWDSVQTTVRSKSVDADSKFRTKFRKSQATKLFLPPNFPDPRVEMAYLQPEVDSDPSPFVWGVPDLSALRAFLMSTIGWSPERTDEILVPVIRDMNQRQQEGTQSNITKFFEGSVGAGAFAPRRRAAETSTRLETALHRIGQRARRETDGDAIPREADGNPVGAEGSVAEQGPRKRKLGVERVEEDEGGQDNYTEVRRKKPKRAAQRRKKKDVSPVEQE